MHALIDQHAIVVTENGSTSLVAAGDPVFPAVRRYLVDERGQDFATVAALVNNIRVAVKGTLNEAVAVVDGDESDTETFLIATRQEIISDGKLEVYSPNSPLGAALLNAKVGETRSYTVPSGSTVKVTLVSAEPYHA